MNPTPPPDLRDIAPPIDVFPYPLWMVLVAGAVVLALLSLAVWGFVRWQRRRRPLPVVNPRQAAVAALERLRADQLSADPHLFSILASDILRRYVVAAHGLKADRQTSPEFLAATAVADIFSDNQKLLLERFLNRCDLLKFGRLDADRAETEALVQQALDFVQEEPVAETQLATHARR